MAGSVLSTRVINEASPALDRLAVVVEAEALPAAAREISDVAATKVRARAPRRTGFLASSQGILPKVEMFPGGVAAKAVLAPKAWYGRLQEQGWQYHPQGRHFFDEVQSEMDAVARPILEEHVKAAIRGVGLE